MFFRFPGLVADSALCSRVIGLGLIPIGSDSWPAKGQVPREGSIVLIHGNGNEPYGIKKFIELLHSKRNDILSKKWLLLDLRESITTDE
ncbi:MAG: hypothetical protein A2268_03910 [Candidatus Raymondbacteria bacterium RifOxyA12_full_50_37]|uniref:Uncharacterized protein n=1 Tax=Candidatus Raymondbacteria bacterium RIFOXYD12_FULL_49_13 TaxID=1817890 RepID=A0A1F7FB55_UNCRA|nr:MAG: hypothetical protein A2268_03910 [Candidatus Raymondbacteria bacterium RifOxyA12_full_50_37]OGJ92630.1 MAG: hypothetical protein A2248_06040 [Candidatus Raymondbacteria bacterium RIFOXYA2_FULL_49_16]OGJ97984.1 MAG: hypothetical protein A2453_03065 [Candidatus Raymondbacteria bacterium RIFOXYC2_FULL_50_21]OGJ99848.1 MAG: hypothetical protein A2487_10865 [Candidatus Raymondbacteria bacterium RifOxyC12_full_50_8]OGK00125.1 MAG: hypothetical protein A2350_05850 [Candidatus Raymondbacteria b